MDKRIMEIRRSRYDLLAMKYKGRGLLARGSRRLSNQESPSGDLGGVPLGRLKDVLEVGLTGEPEAGQTAARPRKRRWARDQTEFLAGHEVRTAATEDSSVRDGDGGPAPTTSEQARGTADIICPDAGVGEGEGAASDSDDEEYTAPLDELLASNDSDDSMDDGGSKVEKDSNGKRAGDDEGGDDIVPPTVGMGRQETRPLGDDSGEEAITTELQASFVAKEVWES
ncbi:hypothetical protein MRB53_033111 [Persea americana]|uniref:Uncharacterized protein n=1 Tax=Persea americana TaxID=3435 RepID=A0ACC2KTK0_PERAE|nr:hypothetical protein MRB53_033111 [Persea americana]